MKIKMPFKKRFKEPMLSTPQQKIWTSRTRCYGKKGDTFPAFGRKFVLICNPFLASLGFVSENWDKEGCGSTEDFVAVWKEIHPRKGFVASQRVYVHVFRRVS